MDAMPDTGDSHEHPSDPCVASTCPTCKSKCSKRVHDTQHATPVARGCEDCLGYATTKHGDHTNHDSRCVKCVERVRSDCRHGANCTDPSCLRCEGAMCTMHKGHGAGLVGCRQCENYSRDNHAGHQGSFDRKCIDCIEDARIEHDTHDRLDKVRRQHQTHTGRREGQPDCWLCTHIVPKQHNHNEGYVETCSGCIAEYTQWANRIGDMRQECRTCKNVLSSILSSIPPRIPLRPTGRGTLPPSTSARIPPRPTGRARIPPRISRQSLDRLVQRGRRDRERPKPPPFYE
jgi:hypothetical protein